MSVFDVQAHKAAERKRKSQQLALTQLVKLEEQREAAEAARNLARLKADYLARNPQFGVAA